MEDYKKPALTFEQQVEHLQKRGLKIESEILAREYLKNISYYRLSGYMYPFLADKANHKFKEGTTLEQVLRLYSFDRELRLLVLDAVERIEVAFRAQMIYHLSHEYGPWWFEKKELFTDANQYDEQREKLEESVKQSDEQFIEHYRQKYNQPNPPAWMVMEVISFNQLSKWYKNCISKEIKKKVSLHFDSQYIELESWIHAIVYIRNLCAHHSRLWNRRLSISPKYPQKPVKQFIKMDDVTNSRLYFTLSIVLYFLNAVNPESTFKIRLFKLFDKYPEIDKAAMGFPKGWEGEPLWQIHE